MCDTHPLDAHDDELRPPSVGDLVEELVVCLTNHRIYQPEHPRVALGVSRLVGTLGRILDASHGAEVQIAAAQGTLFCDGRPLLGASLVARRVTESLHGLRAGGLAFRAGCTGHDVLALLGVLGARPGTHTSHREANEALGAAGCRSIELLPEQRIAGSAEAAVHKAGVPSLPASPSGVRIDAASQALLDLPLPLDLYQDTVDHMQGLTVRVCRGESFSMEEPREKVVQLLHKLREDARSLFSVSRYERYDAFTFGHSIRVCVLALNFAEALTQDEALLHRVGVAALLHDIGKAWVPYEVLHAKGRLTPAERREMNRHTVYGGEMLLDAESVDPLAVAVAFGHHRGTNGQGYPSARVVARQSDVLRIVKICDVYEALTAVRPYKPRMSSLRAFRIMMTMRGHFDTALLKRFMEVTGIYPVGSRVRLDTGAVARVVTQGAQIDLPVVEVEEQDGGPIPPGERRGPLDLSHPTRSGPRRVEALLAEAEI